LEVVEAVIEAGATTVNIPDTVGYSTPEGFGFLIMLIKENVRNIKKAVISVHCHNDLGLATANSLAAVLNGAGQVECTINGIGERAGNCSLEEVVMALRTRKDIFRAKTNIITEEIMRSSKLVTQITGISVQPNKAIVGANAFAHESGIHQDGLLKHKSTYEIIRPETIGLKRTKYVLGKHSSRKFLKERLLALGYETDDEELQAIFERFKKLADQKKEIFDADLEVLVAEGGVISGKYELRSLEIFSGTNKKPTATVCMVVGNSLIQKTITGGDGAVDAVFKVIAGITETKSRLEKYEVKAITGGTDAQGEVTVCLEEDGKKSRGHGADTDIIIASAKAYISALNRLAANNLKKSN
jgi:2-isopropylmalate synthase